MTENHWVELPLLIPFAMLGATWFPIKKLKKIVYFLWVVSSWSWRKIRWVSKLAEMNKKTSWWERNEMMWLPICHHPLAVIFLLHCAAVQSFGQDGVSTSEKHNNNLLDYIELCLEESARKEVPGQIDETSGEMIEFAARHKSGNDVSFL